MRPSASMVSLKAEQRRVSRCVVFLSSAERTRLKSPAMSHGP